MIRVFVMSKNSPFISSFSRDKWDAKRKTLWLGLAFITRQGFFPSFFLQLVAIRRSFKAIDTGSVFVLSFLLWFGLKETDKSSCSRWRQRCCLSVHVFFRSLFSSLFLSLYLVSTLSLSFSLCCWWIREVGHGEQQVKLRSTFSTGSTHSSKHTHTQTSTQTWIYSDVHSNLRGHTQGLRTALLRI